MAAVEQAWDVKVVVNNANKTTYKWQEPTRDLALRFVTILQLTQNTSLTISIKPSIPL